MFIYVCVCIYKYFPYVYIYIYNMYVCVCVHIIDLPIEASLSNPGLLKSVQDHLPRWTLEVPRGAVHR